MFLISVFLVNLFSSIETSSAGEQASDLKPATLREGPHCNAVANWQTLFDGSHLDDWQLSAHGPASWIDSIAFWRSERPYGGWRIDEQGSLHRSSTAGDLRTRETFANFELRLQWRISAGGNSGIKLRVADEQGKPANTGFEMQILDNELHADGANPLTSAGALYGLYPANESTVVLKAGEWNTVHISARGNSVQFYLNGVQTVSAEIGSQDWLDRLSEAPQRNRVSKQFAQYARGHILLQDHFDDVWFRDIAICELPSSI
ncbi:MAG: DUF1080 domain-containing protein [Pseudomonadales bacterium]